MTRRTKLTAFGLTLAVALASPPARSAIKAVALILEVLPSPIRPLRAISRNPQIESVDISGTRADVYNPGGSSPAPALVLVHGAAREGKDDPRIRQLAVALARTGRRVTVPNLGLRHQRLDPQDASRIRDVVVSAAGGSQAGVLAFSYGAALCLVALAEEPRVQDKVAFAATVGTYFDLTHLIQGVTTGTVPYRGRRLPWKPHPMAKKLLPEELAEFLGGEDAKALRSAMERRDPAGLSGPARAVYDLLSNRNPARVEQLEADLPSHVQKVLDALSPSTVVDRLQFPVFAMHSVDDPASPPSESKLLVEALESRLEARLYEVSLLTHVDPTRSPLSNLGEGLRILRFAAAILRSQEGWPRP